MASRRLSVASPGSWYAIVPFALACTACCVPWVVWRSAELGFALQSAFALVCHQQAERSFYVFGGSVAVCARCLGIYLGAALGLLLRAPSKLASRIFVAAAAVSLVDWLAEAGKLHGNWLLVRFVLGVVLGAAGAMLAGSFEKVSIPTRAKEG